MDTIGLRELAQTGRRLIQQRYLELEEEADPSTPWTRDSDIERYLDRVAQEIALCVDYDANEAVTDLTEELLRIFRLAVPDEPVYSSLPAYQATFLLSVIERVYALGGVAVRTENYAAARTLALQLPEPEERPGYYWIRYAVTMASRADEFNRIIGPTSEYVRDRTELFVFFDNNMDSVVNSLCQFDFFHCVLVTHVTNNISNCYPSFGAFWNYRTTPIVRELVTGGAAREALGEIDDSRLADIIVELDRLTSQEFFAVAGWESDNWGDEAIVSFLEDNYRG